jgi:hydrogenase expression/formation protein HypD
VPSSRTSLAAERAAGADVRVVYSARDAVQLAADEPGREVVFAGIGFETTAPTVGAALLEAVQRGLPNFTVLSLHKTMPLPLRALLELGETPVSGFILPGHVSVVTGTGCYESLARDFGVAGVVAGFEPHDVLRALLMLVRQRRPAIEIEYGRAVRPQGNVVAQQLLERVFEPCDADWRGLGVIPGSGLRLRSEFAALDAARRFSVDPGDGTVSAYSLTTDIWYDARGQVVKVASPGGLVTKTQYDGVGRAIVSYITDGGAEMHTRDRMQG